VNRWLVAILLVAALGTAHGKGNEAADFVLYNWDGGTVTKNDLKGKVVVLTFSYAFCSIGCPIITGRLSTLDEAMQSHGDVVYLHISIDPEMDTPERREKYFELYDIDASTDKRWMFLSGDRDQLKSLWEFYGIEIEKVESQFVPEGYYMKYSPKVLVIGKDGLIIKETSFYFMEEEMAELMKDLL
jgi:protein SCO1/2